MFLTFFVFFCGPLKNAIHNTGTHARRRHRDASERAKSCPEVENYSFFMCAVGAPNADYPLDAVSR